MVFTPPKTQKKRRVINIQQKKFIKGYISTLADSRIPNDGLADTLNMTIEQDGLPRPRPSTIRYGEQPLGTVLGMGKFTKIVSGQPEYWEISMQVISGVGKIHVRKDGNTWVAVADSDNTYDDEAWTMFTQTNNTVYMSNGVDAMSFYDVNTGQITKYTSLTTPAAPTVVMAGLTGTTYTQRYKISANNDAGESIASAVGTVQTSKQRDLWNGTTEYTTVTWTAVTGATSYNVYWGDAAGYEYYLTTLTGLSFTDTSAIAANTFRLYPQADSSTGPKLTNLYNKNAQLFGVGDVNNRSYLWYSGAGQDAGDFSPFNGGGYVPIDLGGESIPVSVRSFRDGKGTPALTVLTKGAGDSGKLYHVTFNQTTYGETVIIYPEVYEANGQAGTTSPMAVVEANNNLHYPTGRDFKSTGTKANVVNILATSSIAQALERDLDKLNLAAMHKAVGLLHQDRIYYALPVGADYNNELWVHDLSREGLWLLRWTIEATYMWLYEDNAGEVHHCILTRDNVIVEFTRSVATTDDGKAFSTRLKTGGVVFDEGGVSMASIETVRSKFLYPRGDISILISGIGEDGPVSSFASTTFSVSVQRTGWSDMEYAYESNPAQYSTTIQVGGEDSADPVRVIPIEVDEIVNQLTTEVSTETAGCDYFLSSLNTSGKAIDGLYYGD
jgi:hypothetical protein